MTDREESPRPLTLCLISVHGLIRGTALELGRDADTGGQTKYVVELTRALADLDGVARVDLLTRRIEDDDVDPGYAEREEALGPDASIIRIDAGPPAYLAKEALWDHLDAFVDNTIDWFNESGRHPDLLHSHYADAGYVGSRLSHALGVPLVHTGHSLGRIKRARLIAAGLSSAEVEARYAMGRRIRAEELALATAERVVTSTRQEIESQYERYDYYQPEQMRVIPPGTDLEKFHPPSGGEAESRIAGEIARFLRHPDRPMILALSRPDARKNIPALIEAFGNDDALRERANLVIVAGNRDDLDDLEDGAREVIADILAAVDRHDLYGHVAYPKHHRFDDVPMIYRLAASTHGVFVNPALTEPFGLTLIEAAASGLPVVATEDGGPADIIENCGNGLLVNPLDPAEMAGAIRHILFDAGTWRRMAADGLAGVRRHYSWHAHAATYLDEVRPIAERTSAPLYRQPTGERPSVYHDRALFTDLDQNLLGDLPSLPALIETLRAHRKSTTFGIATGRRLDSALAVMKRHDIPTPDVLITSGGTEIYYAPKLTLDRGFARHIEKNWTPRVVRRTLEDVDGLVLQPRAEQSRFKVSYYIDPEKAPTLEDINRMLLKEDQAVNAIVSFGQFLDILPIRASKGLALRYVAATREIDLDHVLVAGGSGADEDMMRGNTLAVVVGNRHHEELSQLADVDRIYFADARGAAGILEAVAHYDFFGECRVPDETAGE